MRVFLINPDSQIEEKIGGRFSRYAIPVPPQGIAYLAAQLRRAGHQVRCHDQYATKIAHRELVDLVRAYSPDVVGLSVLTLAMGTVRAIVPMLRAEMPGLKVVLGNVHATVFPGELLASGLADLIVRGEGEATFVHALDTLDSDGDLSQVAGLSFLRDDEAIHNPDRPTIADLDTLAYPEWSEFDLDLYKCVSLPLRVFEGTRPIPILAARGCPFHCTYCAQDFAGKRLRTRDLNAVCDEMEAAIENYGADCFGFLDACFPVSKRQGLEFAEIYIGRGLHKKAIWFTETRVDLVDLEVLQALREAECRMIQYGFESGSDRVLQSINKGGKATTARALQTMRDTKKADLLSFGLFMLGSPGETESDCEETIEFARKLDCDIAKFNLVVPYPGSDLFDEFRTQYESRGLDEDRVTGFFDWSNYGGELMYLPEGMSSEQLVRLQRKALRRFYIRPALVWRFMTRRILSFQELAIGAVNLLLEVFRHSTWARASTVESAPSPRATVAVGPPDG